MADLFRKFHLSRFVSYSDGDDSGKVLNPETDDLEGSFFQTVLELAHRDVPRSNRIYVRSECKELYDTVHSSASRVVYLGNPGIGKSLTGLQLLFLLVTLHKDRSTVYYGQKTRSGLYYLFQDGEFRSTLDWEGVEPYLSDEKTFYIHDGSAVPNSSLLSARSVLVTSPDRNVYKDFCKLSGGYRKFYGRLWSVQELKACWKKAYTTLPWADVLNNLRIAGPVPRLVFQFAQEFDSIKTDIASVVASTTNMLSLFELIGPHSMGSSFSHDLLHLDRGSETFLGNKKFASEYVKEQLLDNEQKGSNLKLRGQEEDDVMYASGFLGNVG